MNLGEHSSYHSVPLSSSFHRKIKLRKLRKSVNAVLPVVRLLKSMRRLCVDPAAVEISTDPRKSQILCDEYEYPGHLKLKFSNNVSGPIYTGVPIGDQEGRSLDVHLIDSRTEKIINSGPEASGKVEIVVLEKDFTSCGGDKSLIRGNPQVSLKDGSVCVSHISFKHSRVSMKKRELRLGARVMNPYNIGNRIMEAVTEPFFVKDRRSMGKSLKPLYLDDQVWKLQTIGKGGAFHNRLMKENIITVKDLLTHYFLNRENLLNILGRRLNMKKLDAAVNQAKGKLDLKRYVCPQENPRVVFTDVGELIGLLYQEGQFVSVEQLTPTQKDIGMEVVKTAFQDGHQNSKVLLDDDSFQMLCSSSLPDTAAEQLDGSNNGFIYEAYNYPTDTQQLQPEPNNDANYMPITSFTGALLPHDLLDPDDNDFIYPDLPASIWDSLLDHNCFIG
ncbi:calmodulin-binding protein 60 A-like [Solanum dulcamara]|uniref:calmodulin-binding protein 60 A-like n=1 Tax=Solanum dulcamara TaxID=45834 RepID=UPI0024860D86|nr:calmodulin-binding protein 60 A-like [Solanum dulcamara]